MQHVTAPRPGAIIRGRFPEMEHVYDTSCGKAGRPCLVLGSEVRNGTLHVLVAYGTSQEVQRYGLGEFVLTTREAPFLPKTTKFCLVRRLWLPLAELLACDGPDKSCSVMGYLPNGTQKRVEQAAIEAGLM